jgi:hypothetical protein
MANQAWWKQSKPKAIETYVALYADKEFAAAPRQFGSFQNCADIYVGESFHLLMVGADELATVAASYAASAAREALRVESFEKKGPEKFRRSYDRYLTMRSLYFAQWILTGVRPIHLLADAVRAHFEFFDARPVYFDVEDVLMDYVHSGLVTEGAEMAATIVRRRMMGANRGVAVLTNVLACRARGKSIPVKDQETIERFSVGSRQWSKNTVRLPWWLRLNWLLLAEILTDSVSLADQRDAITGVI